MSHMLLPIPAVQFSGGQVTLPPDPGPGIEPGQGTLLQAAEAWRHQGASWLHIDDHDARGGRPANLDAVRDAVHHTKGHVRFQLSGGVRDEATLNAALETGAARVVIDVGSADRDWVKQALGKHQQRVAAGIDAHGSDVVAPDGTPVADLYETVLELDAADCPRFVVTEAEQKGHWFHHEQHVLAAICESVKHPVIAHGGIKHLSDLHALVELTKVGLEAAIISEPLYSGRFTFPEAVTAIEARYDPYEWGPPHA